MTTKQAAAALGISGTRVSLLCQQYLAGAAHGLKCRETVRGYDIDDQAVADRIAHPPRNGRPTEPGSRRSIAAAKRRDGK